MKYLLLIACLWCSTAMAQKFTLVDNSKGDQYYIGAKAIKGTGKNVDTTYVVDDNKPYRIIETQFKRDPDSLLMSLKVRTVWDEKQKYWIFYSCILEPYKKNSYNYGGHYFA